MSGAPKSIAAPERLLVASVARYAELRGFAFGRHSHDWILTLGQGGRQHLLHGYDLGLNASGGAKVANDKSATHDVLTAAGVSSVPHRVFLHPRFLDFVPVPGNWADLLAAFAEFGSDAVIKDNEGTGGMEVFRARSVRELEQHVHALFQIARAVALSPFVAIDSEQRFIMLDDECLFAYAKERIAVTGDGKSTLAALILAAGLSLLPDDNPTRIPAAGEAVPLQWRHNLGRGARAIPFDPGTMPAACQLARSAMRALGLRFASVDIVATAAGLQVLEVNAGVMLEVLARGHGEAEGMRLVDAIYHRVLDAALGV